MKFLPRLAVPALALWLLGWIALSWTAIQDDALIHLRYADYLHRVHFITYDGIHPSYGASSLLYVALLATLRTVTTSPLLSRYVSTFFHLVLFITFAAVYLRTLRSTSKRVQTFALALLLLLSLPSAVRWLDDGMETGLVLCLISAVVFLTHRLSQQAKPTSRQFLGATALGFLLVLLRNELSIVALFATAILVLIAAGSQPRRLLRVIPPNAHFLIGAILAAISIRLVMGSFLPDTALAKSHGIHHFFPSLTAGIEVIVGALLFGVATLGLWLLSAVITLSATTPQRRLPTLAANTLFPVVLVASCARGQEIQGVRYLVWTFFFSILWNLLELRRADATPHPQPNAIQGPLAFAAFAVVCLVALPVESRLMYRVLTTRAQTMRLFMSQDLAAALPGKLAIAYDVGYISYFTHDPICDAVALVNGRAAASLTTIQRVQRCAAANPDFALLNTDQLHTLSHSMSFAGWRICGQYDFANMHVPDRHYLLVRPALAPAACAATGYPSTPIDIAETESHY